MTSRDRRAALVGFGGAVVAGVIIVVAINATGGSSTPTTTASKRLATTSISRPAQTTTAAVTTTSNAPVASESTLTAFSKSAAAAGGTVAIAATPIGATSVESGGSSQSQRAWSTIKVPIIVTLLRDLGSSAKLTQSERSQAQAAIINSDNDAAAALFAKLKERHGGLNGASLQVQKTLRAAGDTNTLVNTVPPAGGFSTYGQTRWSASNSTRFYSYLAAGCLVDQASTDFVINLMKQVDSTQSSWGTTALSFPAGSVAAKGGWGPESNGGYDVRQAAIVTSGKNPYVVTVVAAPQSASTSFAAGQSAVTAAAKWVKENYRPAAGSKASCERIK